MKIRPDFIFPGAQCMFAFVRSRKRSTSQADETGRTIRLDAIRRALLRARGPTMTDAADRRPITRRSFLFLVTAGAALSSPPAPAQRRPAQWGGRLRVA